MNNNEIELVLKDWVYMWTEVFSAANPDLETANDILDTDADYMGDSLAINNNYDYEIISDTECHFYHYLGMRLPHVARIMLRLDYVVSDKMSSMIALFNRNVLPDIVAFSVEQTVQSFKDFCIKEGIKLSPLFKIEPDVIEDLKHSLTEGMIDTYINHRKQHDIDCYKGEHTIALNCPQSNSINITLNVSFLIIDEILFDNIGFKRNSNRDLFFEKVPECRYYTLKMKCIQISNHPVDLTVVDVQLYLIILDCSLQMLLGDNADKLIPILEERGANKDVRDIFFKSATELFNMYKNSAITPAPTDWNALIR